MTTAKTAHRNHRTEVSKADRQFVYARDKGRCQLCGRKVSPFLFHCDHIKPVAHGGTSLTSNLRLSCSGCNRARGVGSHVGRRYA